jgi:hypothetical protein
MVPIIGEYISQVFDMSNVFGYNRGKAKSQFRRVRAWYRRLLWIKRSESSTDMRGWYRIDGGCDMWLCCDSGGDFGCSGKLDVYKG